MKLITWNNAAAAGCLVTGFSYLVSAFFHAAPPTGTPVVWGLAYLNQAFLNFRYGDQLSFWATVVVALAIFSPPLAPAAQWMPYATLFGVVLLTLVKLSSEHLAKQKSRAV